ncbi:MAG: hypothetical protein ABS35_19630 [Kaistia sp. SCN 65-12]|nr:MAG: hypothetical protein ABS35_19630 [Kaistia sp. SCN 65-12]
MPPFLFAITLMLAAIAAPAVAAEPSALSLGLSSVIDWAAAAIATAVAGFVAAGLKRLFGVTMEARHREALHSALVTGSSLALSLVADFVAQGLTPADARAAALESGVDYVRESVPDALKALKPADGLLLDMVRAKTAQLELAGRQALVLEAPAQPKR